ncbi:alanyl-tRNA editing protein [Citrobacter koseri]|uniref:alanyl-tRNA editing protein n=1 Tax=Citrobacter koseri TaxID=545 RepID=UPI0018E1AE2A|nr:alanyl-tRNA editing protein [Citrobacter koseri]MBI0675857.1 alanyl-tRNA editing protein [Citrobacter koseri]
MTERLYYSTDDTEGMACVTGCSPQMDGLYAVTLDKTLFHPQGGGQPADKGWIADIPVCGIMLRDNQIIHILPQPVAAGVVQLKVDVQTRLLNSRLHSAGHLIGCAGETWGWSPVKAHHWPGEGRITFSAGEHARLPDAENLLACIEQWQAKDYALRIEFDGERRKVGFGELPMYFCGGTHVTSLGQLGRITIGGIKMKKGQLIINYSIE